MAFDDHKNLAISNVATAPSPAISGTSLTVTTGHGTRFPTVPFNVTVWPRNQVPDPDNAEILRVTLIVGDTFTITRAQEGTTAKAIGNNYQIANTVTDKVLTDIEDTISNMISAGSGGGVTADQVSARAEIASAAATSIGTKLASTEAHVDTVSAAVAAVEIHASTASAAATAADTHANAASAAATSIGTLHGTLSDRVTSISAQFTSINAGITSVNAGVASVDAKASIISDRVTSISAQFTSVNAGITSVNARVTSLNTVLGSLSVKSVTGTGSANGLQSIFNVFSNRISALTGGGQTADQVSVRVEVASAAATSVNARITSLEAVLDNISAISVGVVETKGLQSVVDALSNRISYTYSIALATQSAVAVVSTMSVGGVPTVGLQSALNALSNRISAGGGGGVNSDYVSAQIASALAVGTAGGFLSLQNADASAVSAGTPVYIFGDNRVKEANASATGAELVVGLVAATAIAVSATGLVQTAGKMSLTSTQWGNITGVTTGLTPGDMYYLGTSAGTLTTAAPTTGVVHVVGQALSPNELQLMLSPWDDATSALSTITATLDGVVALNSVGVSVFGLQSVINALSSRTGGVASAYVIGLVDGASATAAAALANAVSAGSATASNLLSHIEALSATVAAGGVTTAYISAISARSVGNVSTHGFQSVVNALSARIAAGGGSVTSAEVQTASAAATSVGTLLDTLSGRVTSISAQLTSLEVHASAASAAATSIGVLVSTLSAKVTSISAQLTSVETHINTVSAAVAGVTTGGMLSLQNVDAAAVSAGVPVYAFTSANTFKKADASAVGTELVLGLVAANSIGISAVGLVQTAGKLTLTSAQWNDVASTTTGLTPGTVYYLHTLPGRITATAPTGSAVVHPIGQALSPTEMQLMLTPWDDSTSALSAMAAATTSVDAHADAASAAATSVNARVTSINSLLSAVSAMGPTASAVTGLQAALNALSNRISAGGGGGGSVTSAEFVDAISVGSATASNLLSHIEALSATVAAGGVTTGYISAISARSVGNVSTHGFQSVVNALSARIAAGGGSVTSAEVQTASAAATSIGTLLNTLSDRVTSISAQLTSLEVHASAASAAATAAEVHASAASAAATSIGVLVSTLSAQVVSISAQIVSVETHINTVSAAAAAADAHASVASLAATSIGVLVSTLSAKVTSISAQLTSIDAKASIISDRVTSISAQLVSLAGVGGGWGAVSVLSTTGTGSCNGAQSVLNNLSARLSAICTLVSANRTSISNQVSVAEANIQALSAAVFTNVSALAPGGVSTAGLQSVINALSNRISDVNTIIAYPLMNIDTVPVDAGTPVYATMAGANTFKMANASVLSAVNPVGVVAFGSIAVSAVGYIHMNGIISLASAVWDARTGGAGGLVPGTFYYVGTSAGTLTATLPGSNGRTVGQALSPNAMVMRIGYWGDVGGVGGGATTAYVSGEITSVLAQVSVMSLGSVPTAGLQSALNALSARMEDAIAVGSTTASNLLSNINALSAADVATKSALVNASTVGSIAALSLAIANDASVSAVIKADMASVSAVIMANVSNTLSLQYGLGQVVKVANANQTITGAGFTAISGLAVSVAAGGTYAIDGTVVFTLSILTGAGFGFVYPGTNQVSVGAMYMNCWTSVLLTSSPAAATLFTSGMAAFGYAAVANMSTTATVQISILGGASATQYMLQVKGLVNATSTGVVQLQGKVSAAAAGLQIMQGSFLRANRII